jgi:hypothetical protein
MSSSEEPWSRAGLHVSTGKAMPGPRPLVRAVRRMRYAARYLRAFVRVIVANPGTLWRKTERTIIWGKIRRTIIAWIPGLALQLKRKHRLSGGCTSCGASCNLLFQCPHWDETTRLCSIYDDRPLTCRLFPITPADLRDRDLASSGTSCGYSLVPQVARGEPSTEGRPSLIVR